jgi:hypothetical protein
MIGLMIGIILIFLPFLGIFKFKDKKIGFAHILTFILIFHLSIALITQFLHIFYYAFILIANIFFVLSIFVIFGFSDLIKNVKHFKFFKNIDWIMILMLVIAFISLFYVHYNYTGEYTTASQDFLKSDNFSYSYPYYADEWYSIAFIDQSIKSGELPMMNPFISDKQYYTNYNFFFHSFLSEIFLLLDLNPLTNYVIIGIFFNLMIILLIYLLLLFFHINKLVSSVISLSALYITNGANLAGFWTLIPLTFGIILFLISLFFIFLNKTKLVILSGILLSFFYAPLFPIFFIVALFSIHDSKERFKFILFFLILALFFPIAHLLYAYFFNSFNIPFVEYILLGFSNYISKIFFISYTGDFIPKYTLYNIIPLPILFLSLFGIIPAFRKGRPLFFYLMIGLLYSLFCSIFIYRIFIDYDRIVFFNSILIVIFSGFGLDFLIKKLKFGKRYIYIILILILIFFLISPLSGYYTSRDNWKELKACDKENNCVPPASPVNEYLTLDDLMIFNEIHNKNFLSSPWKGTVIGVSTNNYPLVTKSGTITLNQDLYSSFMESECSDQIKIIKEYKIEYIYASYFKCDGLKILNQSKEGFYLYALS